MMPRNSNSNFDPNKDTLRYDFINSYHKDIDGQEIIFNMEREESKGTNVLFGLIGRMLLAFDSGCILVIDELDNSIHPLILAKSIEMFKSKEYNKKNAQLIFTIHCADILDMNILRVSEVALINKSLKSGSTFKRISDFENVRNTVDFRRMYLNGEFSGIPFPYI
jgi:AAA15 family ATPase/GTPase